LDRHVRAAIRLALEHHPLCRHFADDRRQFWPLSVHACAGCLAAVPAMVAGVVIAFAGSLAGAYPLAVLAASLVLGVPQLSSYVWRGGRAWRSAVKALGGLGIGGVFVGWLLAPVPWTWKWIGAGTLVLAFAGMQALRVRAILRTCDACVYRRDWDRCPGFNLTDSGRPVLPEP